MKYISPLSETELSMLESMFKNHPSGKLQRRAHILILSNKGYHVDQLAGIFQITRQTVSALIDDWGKYGLFGLYDAGRSGRPHSLNSGDEQFIRDFIGQEPRSVKKIQAFLEDKREKKVSEATVRRILKKGKFRWKRIRKSLKSKRSEEKFRKAQQNIQKLEERRLKGEIDVFYFDEAGFNTDPCVPYAWQPAGQTTEIPASKGKRLNVIGIMNKNNHLTPFTFHGSIDSYVVTACLDEFSKNLQKKSFLLIDNAPTHKSNEFISHIPEWVKRGLTVKFLPPYSPELNCIEILWKKIKYEWLPLSSWISFNNLVQAVENILGKFGSEYKINFAI